MILYNKIRKGEVHLKKAALVVLVISLSLFCLLISFEQHSFNKSYYMESYNKYKIEEVTGRSEGELGEITDKLIIYLKGHAGEEALKPHYNEREILHMEDVQVLFKYGFILKYIAMILSLGLIISFALRGEKDLLSRYVFKGLFVNWIILGLLLIMIFFDFDKYFTYFHLIFFNNDLWLLDPRTDLLIQMLPQEFFVGIAIKIGVSFIMYVATIQAIGYALYKKGRNKNEKEFKLFKR